MYAIRSYYGIRVPSVLLYYLKSNVPCILDYMFCIACFKIDMANYFAQLTDDLEMIKRDPLSTWFNLNSLIEK